MRLIDADRAMETVRDQGIAHPNAYHLTNYAMLILREAPTVDAVEVVRCKDCVHAVPLDRNCELSTSLYMHCGLWRGDETKNVWHKYKKYYKDYSLVYREDFCSAGEKIDGKDGE